MDQALGADLGQSAHIRHGVVARRPSHEVSVGVFGDAGDVNPLAAMVDCEQYNIGAFAQPTPDVDGEEVGSDHTTT